MRCGYRAIWTASAMSMVALSAHAQSVLVPTGGTLVGVDPTTVPAAYGAFAASYTATIPNPPGTLQVPGVTVDGSYTQSGLTLNSEAYTYYYGPYVVYQGTVSGSIGFSLVASTTFQYTWSSSGLPSLTSTPTVLTVTGSSGSVVMSCALVANGTSGCIAGPGAGPWSTNLIASAPVTLPADTYTVNFSNTGAHYPGVPVNTLISFALAPANSPPTVNAVVAGKLGKNGWYITPVDLSWKVNGVPAPSTSGCGTVVVPDTAGESFTCTATNAEGSASASVTIKRDSVAPTVSISTPASGAKYREGTKIAAKYSCTDSLSGVASCRGSVVNGAAIDTATEGQKTFTVQGVDNAGNASTQTVTYSVTDDGNSQ